MSLTREDLGQIQTIINDATKGLATREELKAVTAKLATKADLRIELDRMESRITTSMGLLERDTLSRLDQHEARIARLEQARS
ncbi:MAG TPA: hypothetical protein VMT30_03645 [Candidatus Saccharimonadia bacterium]|nr:hypothetical protein [Candidatus Saccharimonadia bacterium]